MSWTYELTSAADFAVSAFFSLHRPISVTSSVPPTATSTSFETIFTSRHKSPRPAAAQVIATLSDTVDSLEAASSQQATSFEESTDDSDLHAIVSSISVIDDSTSSSPHHLDGPPSNSSPLQFPSHLLSGQYKPFTPPSPPTSSSSTSQSQTVADLPSTTLKKSYSTILTILESTHPNGSKTYTARASPIVANNAALESVAAEEVMGTRFLHRMRVRQLKWEEYRRGRTEGYGDGAHQETGKGLGMGIKGQQGEGAGVEETTDMWAISVKRQRRLKMKKHKYKKLMRRTRNLRRRLDRA